MSDEPRVFFLLLALNFTLSEAVPKLNYLLLVLLLLDVDVVPDLFSVLVNVLLKLCHLRLQIKKLGAYLLKNLLTLLGLNVLIAPSVFREQSVLGIFGIIFEEIYIFLHYSHNIAYLVAVLLQTTKNSRYLLHHLLISRLNLFHGAHTLLLLFF